MDSVKAARETCMPPNTVPMPKNAIISTWTPGTRIALSRRARVRSVRITGGWERRCAANSSPPTRVSEASATRPAAGVTAVHRAVASSGPTTKVNSSVTDSNAAAVDISGDFLSVALQRARTMGPICGTVAPVGTATANRVHRGAWARASAVRVRLDSVCSRVTGTSTARWPWRSVSRPARGALTAMEMPVVAATTPAAP